MQSRRYNIILVMLNESKKKKGGGGSGGGVVHSRNQSDHCKWGCVRVWWEGGAWEGRQSQGLRTGRQPATLPGPQSAAPAAGCTMPASNPRAHHTTPPAPTPTVRTRLSHSRQVGAPAPPPAMPPPAMPPLLKPSAPSCALVPSASGDQSRSRSSTSARMARTWVLSWRRGEGSHPWMVFNQ